MQSEGGRMDATLNVRLNATLKERGDKVLRENGISASAAVRALWREMATTRSLPSFLKDISNEASSKKEKARALGQLAGVARGSLSNLSDEELAAVGASRYE